MITEAGSKRRADGAGIVAVSMGLALLALLGLLAPAVQADTDGHQSRVFQLPVWQDADDWARRQQLVSWRVQGDELSQLFLTAQLDPAEVKRLRAQCGSDVECMLDSCQQVRTPAAQTSWLVPVAPPLMDALAGRYERCDQIDSLRWSGQSLSQPGCWERVSGERCGAVRQALLQQPPLASDSLLVLYDGKRQALSAQLARLQMQISGWYPLLSRSGVLVIVEASSAGVAKGSEAVGALAGVQATQPDYRYHSRLHRGGNDQSFRALPLEDRNFSQGSRPQLSIALIDTGVNARLPGVTLTRTDLTGAGYQAAATGTSQASVMSRSARIKLGSFQSCLPVAGHLLRARCSAQAIVRALDQALASGYEVIQLGPQGPAGAVIAQLFLQAERAGAVIITGAGDRMFTGPQGGLAGADTLIAVTALDTAGRRHLHAAEGSYIDLAARGVNLFVRHPGQGEMQLSGSQLAAAQVAVLTAALMAERPEASAAEVRAQLGAVSVDLGPPGDDQSFGAGELPICNQALTLFCNQRQTGAL